MNFVNSELLDLTKFTPYELGRNVLVPFLLVFVILWAVLEKIPLFGKKVNFAIAIGLSLLLVTSSAFVVLADYITQTSGTAMIIIFGALMAGGTFMWAIKRGSDIYREQDTDKILTSLRKKLTKLLKEYRRTNDPEILDQIRNLEDRIKQLEYKAKIEDRS